MKLFNKDSKNEIIVIAEIGVNHMGSLNWILEMLPKVKSAGADAIAVVSALWSAPDIAERVREFNRLFSP